MEIHLHFVLFRKRKYIIDEKFILATNNLIYRSKYSTSILLVDISITKVSGSFKVHVNRFSNFELQLAHLRMISLISRIVYIKFQYTTTNSYLFNTSLFHFVSYTLRVGLIHGDISTTFFGCIETLPSTCSIKCAPAESPIRIIFIFTFTSRSYAFNTSRIESFTV